MSEIKHFTLLLDKNRTYISGTRQQNILWTTAQERVDVNRKLTILFTTTSGHIIHNITKPRSNFDNGVNTCKMFISCWLSKC